MAKEVWVSDPYLPTRRFRKTDWDSVVAKVVTRPGEHLLVDSSASTGMSGYINRNGLRAFDKYPDFTFRAVSSKGKHTDGRVDLYLVATRKEA